MSHDVKLCHLMSSALNAGFVAFALIYWLMPFEQNVRGAAMALCGGYQDSML